MSMGFPPLADAFWELSVLQKPEDPDQVVSCHGAAWDFLNGKDFR